MRTFEYRLYPNKEQSRKLVACLAESRMIYNAMLEMLKAQYEQDGTFPSKYDLEAAFKGQGEHVPATTVQMLADRLSKSLKRFLVAKQIFLVLAFLASKSPIGGIPFSSGSTAKTAICMKIRNTLSYQRSLVTSSRSSCIDPSKELLRRCISFTALMGIGTL